ncbi:MAG TPA: RNA methyltransferase [Nitrospiria bacterium]
MAAITSRQHPRIKEARRFLDPAVRRKEGRFLAEGVRLLEEAFNSGLVCSGFFYTKKLSARPRGTELLALARRCRAPVFEVRDSVLDGLKETKTVQGAVGLFRKPAPSSGNPTPFSVMACGLRDPGNLGTLFRVSEAAGVDEVLVTPGTVDPFNPKSLRAGMGSQFRMPGFEVADPPDRLSRIKKKGGQVIASIPRGGSDPADLDLTRPGVLLVGQEADGLPGPLLAAATHRVTIPMLREVESLNTAIAAGILLYERIRQKKTGREAG